MARDFQAMRRVGPIGQQLYSDLQAATQERDRLLKEKQYFAAQILDEEIHQIRVDIQQYQEDMELVMEDYLYL